MINLTSPLLLLLTLVWGAGNGAQDPSQRVVVQIGDEKGVKVLHGAGTMVLMDDENDKKIVVRSLAQAPKVWIGVRVTSVPAPLASHLTRGGLMIVNVAEDSPADRAGVERYDVVISFADHPIEGMDGLLDAIRETGADNTTEMVVIRGGQEKTLTITPIKGGAPGSWTFKYEEPETPEVDQFKKYFGHRFKLGPHGEGLVLPYGRLDRLPEDIEEMLEDIPDIDWEEWSQKLEDWAEKWEKFEHKPFDIHIGIDSDDWLSGDEEAKAEIRIRLDEDDNKLTIERAEDGTITVERENADGQRSSETYEDIHQLREEDPEAYKTYRRFLVLRSPRTLVISPDLKNLGIGQHEFQIELKMQLEKAREQLGKAGKQLRKARRQVEIRKEKVKSGDEGGAVHEKNVTILVNDGRITVEIEEDGASKKYEFDSPEDFKSSEPELYERFKKHLDDAGARRNESDLTSATLIA